ncbi:MAG: stage II sporulation protein M [Bacillota bacterium]
MISLIFAGAVLLGEYLPELQPGFAKVFERVVSERLAEIAGKLKNLPFWLWIIEIWLNNVMASFTAVFLGLLCPVFSLLILMENGMIMGLFQRKMELLGLRANHYYLGLIPHGIFEIPAFFIAVMMGMQLGIAIYRLIGRHLKGKGSDPFFQELFRGIKDYLWQKGRYYAGLIAILLSVAAVLEVTVSPILLRLK